MSVGYHSTTPSCFVGPTPQEKKGGYIPLRFAWPQVQSVGSKSTTSLSLSFYLPRGTNSRGPRAIVTSCKLSVTTTVNGSRNTSYPSSCAYPFARVGYFARERCGRIAQTRILETLDRSPSRFLRQARRARNLKDEKQPHILASVVAHNCCGLPRLLVPLRVLNNKPPSRLRMQLCPKATGRRSDHHVPFPGSYQQIRVSKIVRMLWQMQQQSLLQRLISLTIGISADLSKLGDHIPARTEQIMLTRPCESN